jgi:hypothetical protein
MNWLEIVALVVLVWAAINLFIEIAFSGRFDQSLAARLRSWYRGRHGIDPVATQGAHRPYLDEMAKSRSGTERLRNIFLQVAAIVVACYLLWFS